jgi:diguanylate cyclase (GGDEF)-like protein/PAS domain S-box-containing protein
MATTPRHSSRRSEAWAGALIASSRDVVWVRTVDGVLVYASPAVEATLGYRPEELEGRNERDLIHHTDINLRDGSVERLLASDQPQAPLELRVRHRDGSFRWLEMVDTNRLADPAVRGIVTNARDVTSRKTTEDELVQLTFRDPLTGLPNRALLMDRIAVALAHNTRSSDILAVLFCDLDGFKVINDGLGHAAGDQVLVSVAQRLVSAVRHADTVARTGGDEFVVVCDGLRTIEDATEIAQQIRDAVEEPILVDGRKEAALSVSIGIVTTEGFDARNVDPMTMLRNADAAMYRAKKRGRARWELYDEALIAEAAQRVELEPELRRALEHGELAVYYQPIIDLTSGEIVGAEALLRWNHPSRGQLMPLQFVGLAEETGIIVPIGEWVLREACAQARSWQEDHAWPGWISVNVTARQVAQSSLGSTVSDVLTQTGLDPHALWLELTETALLRTGNSAAGELVAIEALGAHIGMDDFGTGYASLSNLQRLPIDFLKIDSDFVTRLGRDASSPENGIVAAIIQLGKTLDLQIVAEGIETALQLETLRAYGCTKGQGSLFARPVTAAEVATLLAAPPRRPS